MAAAPEDAAKGTAEDSPNATWVAQMRPALLKYFRRKTNSLAEAEDLTQDVLLSTLGRSRWENADQAKGYVFRSAVNRWRDRNRRAQIRGPTIEWTDALAERRPDEVSSPERVLVMQQELHRVVSALQELNERTRNVLILARLENMKLTAIAESLGISISAVNKHLAKAVAHLARCAARTDASP